MSIYDIQHTCQINITSKISDKMSNRSKLSGASVCNINKGGDVLAACSDGVVTDGAGTIAAVNAEKKHPVFIKNKKDADSLLVDKRYVYTDM